MTSSLDMIRGRSNVVTLTNNSGGALVAGDVCIQDTSADEKATTTTSAASVLKVFVAAEAIANGATGRFYESGYCPLVNVNASVTRGRFLFTHTVAKQAAENATYGAGAFGKILKSGTTPSAIIYSATAQSAGGSIGGSSGSTDNAIIRADGTGGSTVQSSLATVDDSGGINIPTGQTYNINGSAHTHAGGAAAHEYFDQLCALLEPDCIEPIQSSTFSYVVASNETKYVVGSFSTRLGAGGRWEVRDPRVPVPLRGVTLTGLSNATDGSRSFAVLLDPALPTYADSWTTYYDRLNTIATSATKYMPQGSPLLPGPYGSIVTSVSNEGYWFVGIAVPISGGGYFNLGPENDSNSQYFRNHVRLNLPITKHYCNYFNGVNGGSISGITYVILDSSWSAVSGGFSQSGGTFDFRDDFMAATIDTATKWTLTQSTAGNVAIDTDYQWCKITGNSSWGGNGAISKTSINRAVGKIFLCDVFVAASQGGIGVGFHDGAGVADSDFSHGVEFGSSGAIHVKENGNDRGAVGSGWTGNYIYRVRITLGTNNAAYAIQGGREYQPIGSGSWTDITPGTTSSTTTPLYAGFNCYSGSNWVSDVKLY